MLFLALLGLLFRVSDRLVLRAESSAHSVLAGDDRPQRVSVRILPGDNLASLLVRHGLESPSAQALIHKLRPFLNVRALPVGQKLDLVIDADNASVRGLETVVWKHMVRADATTDGWAVEQRPLPFTTRFKLIHGRVTDDFAHSAARAGVTPAQIKQLEKIFAADVDLLRDGKEGDSFAVVVGERFYTNGQRSVGSLAAASLEVAGAFYNAFKYGESGGQARYFDADGVRLPHRFMAAPLKYDRISSTFGLARPDPMTGKLRPHEAIDYVAAAGTPVIAVGDGVVEFAGWYGGYGNFVEIDHGKGYGSAYGHLSAFADHLEPGKRVKAGEVIGYVGDTGHSTGPHLHFEFSLNQEKLDYLVARVRAGETLSGKEARGFDLSRDEKLAVLRDGNIQIAQLPKLTSY